MFHNFFVHVGEYLANEIPATYICPAEYIAFEVSEKVYASAATGNEIYEIIFNS